MRRSIDSSDASFGSVRELATEINEYLGKHNKVYHGIGNTDDIFLCHFLRHHYIYNPNFKDYKSRVLIQPIDGTVIAPVHVKELNRFDLIITPATPGKTIMQNSGVTTMVKVIPNYYDPMDIVKVKRLKHRNLLPPFDDKFLFYHESSLQPRKNVGAMIEAYLLAFSDTDMNEEVHLAIKGITESEFERIRQLALVLRKKYEQPAKISLISSNFSKYILRKIWSTVDCYISFAHMEGFGIPLLRMAVNQKPIITLRSEISGYMDFLNDRNTYFVDSKKCKLAEEARLIYDTEKSHWEDVESIEAAAGILRTVYKDSLSSRLKVNREELVHFRKDVVMRHYNEVMQNC